MFSFLCRFKVGTHKGTSNWPFSLQNLVARGQTLVPATSPKNSNQFEFLGQVLTTCSSCKEFILGITFP